MLEAQQRMMGDADCWSLKPVLLPGDAGVIRARRVLDGLIATEQKQASQPAPALQSFSSSSTEAAGRRPAHLARQSANSFATTDRIHILSASLW